MNLITPTLVTVILDLNSDFKLNHQWNFVFCITAVILLSGGIVFLLFASSGRLKWLDANIVNDNDVKNLLEQTR